MTGNRLGKIWMTDDGGYDRDNQKGVSLSWVRKQVIITTSVVLTCLRSTCQRGAVCLITGSCLVHLRVQ